MRLLVKESLVLLHFAATVLSFVVAIVANFGQNPTHLPFLGTGSAVLFVLLFAAHLPLDRMCGFDK